MPADSDWTRPEPHEVAVTRFAHPKPTDEEQQAVTDALAVLHDTIGNALDAGVQVNDLLAADIPLADIRAAQQRAIEEPGPAKPYPGHYRTDRKGDDA